MVMAASEGEGRRDREGAEGLVINQCEKMMVHEIHSERGCDVRSTRTVMLTRRGWNLGIKLSGRGLLA
jgi:hypothetical protein